MYIADLLDVDGLQVSDEFVEGPCRAQIAGRVRIAVALQDVRDQRLRLLARLFDSGQGLLTDLFERVFR